MPDLDDDLIARLSDAARDHGGDWEGRLFAEAATRLTAAAEREERLRDALREAVIFDDFRNEAVCSLCMCRWLSKQPEQHTPGCLAALAAAPSLAAAPEDRALHCLVCGDPVTYGAAHSCSKDRA